MQHDVTSLCSLRIQVNVGTGLIFQNISSHNNIHSCSNRTEKYLFGDSEPGNVSFLKEVNHYFGTVKGKQNRNRLKGRIDLQLWGFSTFFLQFNTLRQGISRKKWKMNMQFFWYSFTCYELKSLVTLLLFQILRFANIYFTYFIYTENRRCNGTINVCYTNNKIYPLWMTSLLFHVI